MKERPILFSGPMVRAILEGRKTQTRRVVKNATRNSEASHPYWPGGYKQGKFVEADDCPYGQIGERLWVRETHALLAGGTAYLPGEKTTRVAYKADREGRSALDGQWRPSIHMPRWASRITLEIAGVRVERLGEISDGDVAKEGVDWNEPYGTARGLGNSPAQRAFARLWQSINGPGSWDANPWVWVIEFRRVQT